MNNYTNSNFYKRYTILLDFSESAWRSYQINRRSRSFIYAILLARWVIGLFVVIWFYLMGIAFANLTMLDVFDQIMKDFASGALNLTASDPLPTWAPLLAVVFCGLFGLGIGGATLETLRVLRAQLEHSLLDIHKPMKVGEQPVRSLVRAIRISGIKLNSKTPKLITTILTFIQQQIEYVTGPLELASLRIVFDFVVVGFFVVGGSLVTSLLVEIKGWLFWMQFFANGVFVTFFISFFVGTFLFVAFPGMGRKISASIGFWRVYEPQEQIISQTISAYLREHFADEEIHLCESITKLRLERRSQTETSIEASLALFGIIIALIALASTGDLINLPFDQQTLALLMLGVIGFLFLTWLWSFLSLQGVQGDTYYVLSSIVEACTITTHLKFRVETPENQKSSSIANQG